MKKICLLLASLFIVLAVSAQPGSKESFIPDNWTLIEEVSGDLNKDSVSDVALIIEYAGDALEGERPRSLLILLKIKPVNCLQKPVWLSTQFSMRNQAARWVIPLKI